MDVLTPQAREGIAPKEARAAVLAYVAIDNSGKKELLKKIALSGYGSKSETETATLEKLAELGKIYYILNQMRGKIMEAILDLMEVDCEEIDKQLLPPNAFRDAMITRTSAIAPPQGYPFLDETLSMEKMLDKMPFLYR